MNRSDNEQSLGRATATARARRPRRIGKSRHWSIAPLLVVCSSLGCVAGDEDPAVVEPADAPQRAPVPSGSCAGEDLVNAPPSFAHADEQAVFVDICSVEATLEFDTLHAVAQVSATVTFHQAEPGYPVIDLVPAVDSLSVDRSAASAEDFVTVFDPDDQSELRLIEVSLQPGLHTARVEYLMPTSRALSFTHYGTVDFFAKLSDLEPRSHLEKYFPSNLAYDAYAFDLNVAVSGDSEHQVFTNGQVTAGRNKTFDISFPAFFNSTRPYLHVAPAGKYTVLRDSYAGLESDVALTVYGCAGCRGLAAGEWRDGTGAAAMAEMKEQLGLFEKEFGAFLEPSVVVRAEPAAPERAASDVDHEVAAPFPGRPVSEELRHRWLGRAVMPANGNAEWLDDAIVGWADWGYPRAETLDQYPGAKLSGFSPYRRQGPKEAYEAGREVLAMLDLRLADQGGLRPLLVELHEAYAGTVITTESFVEFLEGRSSSSLDSFFKAKVYSVRW